MPSLIDKVFLLLFVHKKKILPVSESIDLTQGRHKPIEIDLTTAFGTGQVEILFQPVVNLADLTMVGVEALARLRDSAGRIWLPDQFVPAAEKAGLAPNMSENVVAEAILDFTTTFPLEANLWLAINLPLSVFLALRSPAMVAERAKHHALPPARITIELTESQPVLDMASLRHAIARWHLAGFKIALDDIEPATHNLWQLLDEPFAAVKLDMSVVTGLSHNAAAVDFVTDVVAHANKRGIHVVAEGVESEPMATQLRALGVDHAQGFLISRPMQGTLLPAWWCNWLS